MKRINKATPQDVALSNIRRYIHLLDIPLLEKKDLLDSLNEATLPAINKTVREMINVQINNSRSAITNL